MHNSAQYSTTYFTVQVKSPQPETYKPSTVVIIKLHPRFASTFCVGPYNTHATLAGFDCRFNQSAMWEDSPGLMRRVFFFFVIQLTNLLLLTSFLYFIYFYLSFFHVRSLGIQHELSKATGLLYNS